LLIFWRASVSIGFNVDVSEQALNKSLAEIKLDGKMIGEKEGIYAIKHEEYSPPCQYPLVNVYDLILYTNVRSKVVASPSLGLKSDKTSSQTGL
jgi:hypothetical protein